MKNLKVTAMILAATLSAGTLVACSSGKETNETASTVESETVETEESVATESESSELMEEQELDAMTEAVLQYITVARVEKVAEDGKLDLTLFELPETSEEATDASDATDTATKEAAAELNEAATAEETNATEETAVTEETTVTEAISATEVTAEEEQAEKNVFDFASLDLSMFVETEQTEAYQPEETVMVQLAEDGALVEAALSDVQEGDMLVIFVDENEVPNIIIYRNIAQEETVAE